MKRMNTNFRPAPRRQFPISEFRGVDLNNSPTNVASSRSPAAPNMIRDVPGKVRKRMGYHPIASYGARINGIYRLITDGAAKELVHAGTKLYCGTELLYENMNDARSKAWQMRDNLYILDGRTFLCYDGTDVKPVSEKAYQPTIYISRKPAGGGTVYERANLLGSQWTEQFLGDGASLVYQLSADELDDWVTVKIMKTANQWTELTRTAHYSFDPVLGTVTFIGDQVPGPPVIDGADNVSIQVKKTRTEYVERINKCDMSVLYGVGGAADRLFVTGNPAFRNYDWYSGLNDPSYFPVTAYCILGLSTRIMGYSIIGDRLAAHKSDDEDGRNIIIRSGTMTDNTAAFPIVNTLQGAGMLSGHTVAYLKTEPLFFSESGIYAVTPADTNGERYTQNRSYFINTAICAEPDRNEAVAVGYRDFYLLALGGKIYVLDSLLKSYEDGAPYSTHQYEAFVLTHIDVRVFYKSGDALRFGTHDGRIMEFYTDEKSNTSYNDDGRPIDAWWDTPLFSGESFYMLKNFKYLAVRLLAATETGTEVFAQIRGIWKKLFSEFAKGRYLSFAQMCFSRFVFSCDQTPQVIGRRLTLPKTDKIQFRFRNANLNEPFGLYNIALEYRQNGKIR